MKIILILVALLGSAFCQNTPGTSACTPNNVAYVGGPCALAWGGGDIGAQINTAVAALSYGGHIHVTAGMYPYSTPIVIVGNGKPITLDCDAGSAGSIGAITGPTVLRYQPTTGVAVTIAESLGAQMNGCTLAGPGNTTSTVGLLVGGPTTANSTINGTFAYNNISNFGVGLQFGYNSYIDTFINNDIHDNGPNGGDRNIYVPPGTSGFGENITFVGGQVDNVTRTSYSTVCVDIRTLGDIKFYGTSFDQCGITIDGTGIGLLDLIADHFENPNHPTAADFITIGPLCSSCTVNIVGGFFYEHGPSSRTEFIVEGSSKENNSNSVSITGTVFTPQESTPVVRATGSANCCQRVYVKDYQPGTSVSGPFAGTWLGTTFEYAGIYETSGIISTRAGLKISGCPTGTYVKADGKGCGPIATGSTAMPTGALGASACSSAVIVPTPDVTSSMHITWNLATSPVGVAGYGSNPVTVGAWLTDGSVHFIQCATTAITPGSMSLNWVVTN